MIPKEEADLIRLIKENLDIRLSTDRSCSCCSTKYLKIDLLYADEVIGSDMIYVSSLQE